VDDCAFYCGEIYKEYLREDDPDNELAIRYYKWASALDPQTPHAARFQCAVVYDFRRHDRIRALELYNQVLRVEEDANMSNMRFAASRIRQLTDDEFSRFRPRIETADGTSADDPADWDTPFEDPVTANYPDDETDPSDPDITP
jgi:tetratricopeptide (TPR) repeat protein